ncbi:uncharacterized protein DUF3450 [Desulfobotulus alkaliphilus]|uniref:Uncharacterized protein DUF3450 n=1 Tax=Desulfobotulus alkaliphilus TaxID=622671 RepID=A0A562RTQ8_9BACT|nr:DUF3450 family protein [Desulfobotulus alkaliphilus]TWI71686.1 uncharacterized protein DUF3450 [Desulfobotulus alkaliphilus]
MKKIRRSCFCLCLTGIFLLSTGGVLQAEVLEKMDAALGLALEAQAEADAFLRERQEEEALLMRLRMEAEALRFENHMLEKRIAGQHQKLEGLEAASDPGRVARLVEPLLGRLTDALEERMDNQPPFGMEARKMRVQRLREAMEDGEKNTEDRFRLFLDGMEAELNLGVFPDTAPGIWEKEGETLRGIFLHLGAAGLFFLSPDGDMVARWDRETRNFHPLDRREGRAVERALAMVQRRMPTELISLPVSLPEVP